MTDSATPGAALILVNAPGQDNSILEPLDSGGRVKRKRTEMVVELEEVFVIRNRQTMSFDWCDTCGDQVRMVTPDQAATITGLGSRHLYRSIEAGRIHFNETSEGHLLICQRSLPKAIERETTSIHS